MEKSRNRKQQRMVMDGAVNNGGDIDRLPNDLVIKILSHMSIKRAARTSVLAHRWRYLWRFSHGHGTLRFDGKHMKKEEFQSWVNGVLDLHLAPYIEGLIISFEGGVESHEKASTSRAVERWLNFAMQKEVQRLELNLSFENLYGRISPTVRHAFPTRVFCRLRTLEELRSHSFCRLRSLRLSQVHISTNVVHYFLASCPDLEELCIQFSYNIRGNLRVVDPPSLRVLEITRCPGIRSLEISAVSLVSLTYGGPGNSLLLIKAPNLRELCVRRLMCLFFVFGRNEHSSYFVQLEKLVLDFRFLSESITLDYQNRDRDWVAPPTLPRLCSLKRLQVHAHTKYGARTPLDIFTSLIEASPHLCEFRIELSYSVDRRYDARRYELPRIEGFKVGKFVHRNLKVLEMSSYVGFGPPEELLVALIWSCPSLERVAIHIGNDFYDNTGVGYFIDKCRRSKEVVHFATSREEAKGRAQRFIAKTRKQKPSLQEWKQCQWERLEFIVT
ncbi:putative F-box/FBD/LRR-repeat protein At3g49040 [Salvia miltiorrhiza]|uniref:putative F-box/FBD/LRR-repeat protein At3g49040 n=1 Tax=Salvia miltiorrhiza TaxID=226208 RepID=UPI0025AC163E|nr:putative F-box/FBD/LRR-repeat protein At3g49040 [Salvia miltiorrhiza]